MNYYYYNNKIINIYNTIDLTSLTHKLWNNSMEYTLSKTKSLFMSTSIIIIKNNNNIIKNFTYY